MTTLWRTRTTLIWMLLVGATMLSWAFGHGVGFSSPRAAGAAIIVVTFIKVRFVMLDFMELRSSPRWMRVTAQAWMLVISSSLIVLFVDGSP